MENQSKFCMHCGKPLQPGQVFCASCGAKVTPQSVMQSVGQASQSVVVPEQPKKTKKKIWLWSGVAIGLIAIISIVLAIVLNIKGQDRTIMVYMIGSDLESETAAASLDITEMKDAHFDSEHTKVLVYTGGTKKWALDEVSAEEAIRIIKGSRIYLIDDCVAPPFSFHFFSS